MIAAKDATGNTLIFNMPPLGRWISKAQVAFVSTEQRAAGFVIGAGEVVGRTATKEKSLLAATPADIWLAFTRSAFAIWPVE